MSEAAVLVQPEEESAVREIVVGEYVLDADTGEILGLAGVKEDFTVTDEKSADWVLEKLMDSETNAARLEMKLRAITENLTAQIKAEQNRQKYLRFRFGPSLEHFARQALQGKKIKTLTLTFGKLSLRVLKGGLRVMDQEKALAWARELGDEEFCGRTVKVVESFQISQLTPEEKAKIIEELEEGPPTPHIDPETGEETPNAFATGYRMISSAFAMEADETKFGIKTGVSK